ncbi:MAG: sugar ABC transporter ATP-binding protein [Chloroflexota bacterium]
MVTNEFLVMRDITKRYDGTQALKSVNFSGAMGEVHAICGENGAGKSTLVKVLTGAIQRDGGEIVIDGEIVDLDSPIAAHNLGIRAVYQEFSLISHLSVTENILVGQMPTHRTRWWVDWNRAHFEAMKILSEIGFSGINVHTIVSQLSVSQQQMVEIAKALAKNPRILILDEPSAVLSQEELHLLFDLLKKLKEQGKLILYISHRLDEVFEVADRITVLKDGCYVGTVRPEEVDQTQLIRMMTGRMLTEIYPKRESQLGEPILKVSDLGRAGSFEKVSFSLHRGEILGVFGLVGSGRSAMAKAIFGATPADSGTLTLAGHEFHPANPRVAIRNGIALLTEDRKRDGLVLSCSIADNIILPSLDVLSKWIVLDQTRTKEAVQGKVNELNIRPSDPKRKVRSLSGGNQQKVVLAKWLLTGADLLILDEPTRGVDVATKVEFYQLMAKLAQAGIGILLISSELPEILGLSDRILIMREGRIVGELSSKDASEERVLSIAAGVTHETTRPL